MRFHRVDIGGIEDLELATGGNREFRPTQIGTRQPTGKLELSVFGGITLTYGRFNSDIHVSGTLSNQHLSMALLLPGTRGVTVFGKHASPGDLLVVAEGRENDARYRSELEYIILNVNKAKVLRVAEAEDHVFRLDALDGSDLFSLDDGRADRVVRWLNRIEEGLRNGSLQGIGREAERSLADEIVLEFVCCLSDAGPKERVENAPSRDLPKVVKRAEDWLDADPFVRPSIEDLSRVLAVSPRQLYRAFQAEVEMSPAKFLKRHRMTQARLELVDTDPAHTTVTHVANSWGSWELGRFAVEYRRLFGESPSQTLRKCPASHARGRVIVTESRAHMEPLR